MVDARPLRELPLLPKAVTTKATAICVNQPKRLKLAEKRHEDLKEGKEEKNKKRDADVSRLNVAIHLINQAKVHLSDATRTSSKRIHEVKMKATKVGYIIQSCKLRQDKN